MNFQEVKLCMCDNQDCIEPISEGILKGYSLDHENKNIFQESLVEAFKMGI